MSFREYLKNNIVYLDGGMGTLLQAKGLTPGEFPERWNISHPDVITEIQKLYFDAGSNVVCTNTFGANSLKFDDNELESIIRSAIENAKRARDLSGSNKDKFIKAFSISLVSLSLWKLVCFFEYYLNVQIG